MHDSDHYAHLGELDLYQTTTGRRRNSGLANPSLVATLVFAALMLILMLPGCVTQRDPAEQQPGTGPGYLEPPPDTPYIPPPGVCHQNSDHSFPIGEGVAYLHRGLTYLFCCEECLAGFLKQHQK